MPYGSILYGEEENVRNAYIEANNTLSQALGALDSKPEEAKPLLLTAYNQYRVVGLLMPFYAIKKDKRSDITQRYLKTLDLLATVINTLAKTVAVPVASEPWYSDGLVWKHLGKMGHALAQAECGKQTAARSENWHLAKFQELAGKFRDMKDAEKNKVFGAKAAGFKQAWMLEASEIRPSEFMFLHFAEESTGSAAPTEEYEVICVATEVP